MWVVYNKFHPYLNNMFQHELHAEEFRYNYLLDPCNHLVEEVNEEEYDAWLLCKTLAAPLW